MLEVETRDRSDDGGFIESEVIVTHGDTQYIITEYSGGENLTDISIYERETGDVAPRSRVK